MANGIMNDSRDVAVGVLWSIDHCTRPQGDVAGKSCGKKYRIMD
jgi:hypothetical protein